MKTGGREKQIFTVLNRSCILLKNGSLEKIQDKNSKKLSHHYFDRKIDFSNLVRHDNPTLNSGTDTGSFWQTRARKGLSWQIKEWGKKFWIILKLLYVPTTGKIPVQKGLNDRFGSEKKNPTGCSTGRMSFEWKNLRNAFCWKKDFLLGPCAYCWLTI